MRVKKNLKIGQRLPKLWAINYRFFFMKHGVYTAISTPYSTAAERKNYLLTYYTECNIKFVKSDLPEWPV